MLVKLDRLAYLEACTFGRLRVGDEVMYVIEPPWRDNQRGRSCIPEGTYPMTLGRYNRGGYATWELENVPGRSLIKVHRGNWVTDTRGCLILGTRIAPINRKLAVQSSRQAHARFMAALQSFEQDGARIIVGRDHQINIMTDPNSGRLTT